MAPLRYWSALALFPFAFTAAATTTTTKASTTTSKASKATSATTGGSKASEVATATVASATGMFPTGTAAASATATGNSFDVDEKSDGSLYVSFSDSTRTSLQNAYSSSCGSTASQTDCEDALAKVLTSDEIDLQTRQVVVTAIGVVYIAAQIKLYLDAEKSTKLLPSPLAMSIDPGSYHSVSSIQAQKPTRLVIVQGSTTVTVSDALDASLNLKTVLGGATTTASRCPTTPIICQDDECQAPTYTVKTCVASTNSGCPCTNEGTLTPGQAYDSTAGVLQASILNSLITGAAASPTGGKPSCFANSDSPITGVTVSPATWCVCKQSVDPAASNTIPQGEFSTLPSVTGSGICDYTTMPSKTITIQTKGTPAITSVSCSKVVTTTPSGLPSAGSQEVYCTCNNGEMKGLSTTSLGGQTSSYCQGGPTPTLTPTTTSTTAAPTPVGSLLVIWDTPPVSGDVFYDIYNAPPNFDKSLNNDCGNDVGLPLNPLIEPKDPNYPNGVPNPRPKSMSRGLPGKLPGTFDLPGRTGCYYQENNGAAAFNCATGEGALCQPPIPVQLQAITPNYDECGGFDTRTLVRICPYF